MNTTATTTTPFRKGSQNSRLLNALTRGQKISASQARSRFGITNVSARVREMRSKGVNIVTNYKTYNDGTRKAFYTLG
jgi:hypothetical protein